MSLAPTVRCLQPPRVQHTNQNSVNALWQRFEALQATLLSVSERCYLEKLLDLLYLTELVILVEYTEMIPAVYCKFTLMR